MYGYIKRSKLLLKLSRKYPVDPEFPRSHDSQGCRKGEKDPLALQFMAYDFRKCLMKRAYTSPWDTQRCAFARVTFVRGKNVCEQRKSCYLAAKI